MAEQASAQTRAVIATHAAMVADVRRRVVDFVTTSWDRLGNYRDRDIERFVAAVVPVVEAGQRQVATLTNAYLANIAAQVLGEPVEPLPLTLETVIGAAVRSGSDPQDVYTRPGITTWTALAHGDSLEQAVSKGRNRARSLASTDLELSKTHTAREVLSRDKRVVGSRRVLNGKSSCGLCVVASTQRYHKRELLPIHPGCDCGVEPIYEGKDPGQVIDLDRLDAVHKAIADRFGSFDASGRSNSKQALDYRDVLITHEHGEIGPILGVRGQEFTGPDDI